MSHLSIYIPWDVSPEKTHSKTTRLNSELCFHQHFLHQLFYLIRAYFFCWPYFSFLSNFWKLDKFKRIKSRLMWTYFKSQNCNMEQRQKQVKSHLFAVTRYCSCSCSDLCYLAKQTTCAHQNLISCTNEKQFKIIFMAPTCLKVAERGTVTRSPALNIYNMCTMIKETCLYLENTFDQSKNQTKHFL